MSEADEIWGHITPEEKKRVIRGDLYLLDKIVRWKSGCSQAHSQHSIGATTQAQALNEIRAATRLPRDLQDQTQEGLDAIRKVAMPKNHDPYGEIVAALEASKETIIAFDLELKKYKKALEIAMVALKRVDAEWDTSTFDVQFKEKDSAAAYSLIGCRVALEKIKEVLK